MPNTPHFYDQNLPKKASDDMPLYNKAVEKILLKDHNSEVDFYVRNRFWD